MTFDLHGKTALITGGGAGIGLATAQLFIAQGARVVIADIGDATSAAEAIGAHFVQCDVAKESAVQQCFENAKAQLDDHLDIVVLNAGIGDVGTQIIHTPTEQLRRITEVNYWGVFYGLKIAPGFMRDHGAIISTASLAAFVNVPGSASYSAAKKAVVSLTEMSALELGSRGIRVNCICPGYVDTAMGSGAEGQQLCEAFTALGRMAQVDDVTGVFLFLASAASRYITGQAIKVDGGWSCGPSQQLMSRILGTSEAPS